MKTKKTKVAHPLDAVLGTPTNILFDNASEKSHSKPAIERAFASMLTMTAGGAVTSALKFPQFGFLSEPHFPMLTLYPVGEPANDR